MLFYPNPGRMGKFQKFCFVVHQLHLANYKQLQRWKIDGSWYKTECILKSQIIGFYGVYKLTEIAEIANKSHVILQINVQLERVVGQHTIMLCLLSAFVNNRRDTQIISICTINMILTTILFTSFKVVTTPPSLCRKNRNSSLFRKIANQVASKVEE